MFVEGPKMIWNFGTALRVDSLRHLQSNSPSILLKFSQSAMAEPNLSSAAPEVHIVYTEKPQGDQPETRHLRTLTSVLGSEEAAKGALCYTYKSAATGFSAKLTRDQAAEISKQPGVLQVVKSGTVQLH